MQACLLTGDGHWSITDIPKPRVDDDDVLIHVKAAGICGSDMGILNGKYPLKGDTVMGHEFSGVVAETGKKVKDWHVGQHVVQDNTASVCGRCHLCGTGRFVQCADRQMIGGTEYPGGFAEYVRIPGNILKIYPACMFTIPQGITFEEAAIVDPLANAYNVIIQKSSLRAGDTFVVFGVGAIGLSCVMMAKLVGAGKIIAVGARKTARLQKAKELGATHVFAAEESEDIVAEIKSVAGIDGVAVAADCAAEASEVIGHCIQLVRNGGQILSVGMSRMPLGYSLVDLGLKNQTLIGHMGYDNISWRNVLALMESKALEAKNIISHVMPLSRFGEGLELINRGEAIKVILHPGE